jgi:hypothetical protein
LFIILQMYCSLEVSRCKNVDYWQETGISKRNIIGYTVAGSGNDLEQTRIAKRIISGCTVQGSGSSWGETCCLRDS